MTIASFFSKANLFDPTPARDTKLLVPLLVFFGLLTLFGILLKVFRTRKNLTFRRFSNTFWIVGLLGLIYVFGRYETLPWLGSGIYLVTIVAVFLFWAIINFIWAVKNVPSASREQRVEEIYQKYLPKPKRIKHKA